MVLVTTTGLTAQSKYTNCVVAMTATNGWRWMAIGTATSSELMADIALGVEISTGGGQRSTCSLSHEANFTSVWANTFTFTTNYNVNECAIFGSSSTGGPGCFMRHSFTATKPVGDGDTLAITLKLVQST
jgi:hypothetical protein